MCPRTVDSIGVSAWRAAVRGICRSEADLSKYTADRCALVTGVTEISKLANIVKATAHYGAAVALLNLKF